MSRSKQQVAVMVLSALVVPAVLWAAEVAIPHVFSAGTPIRADEMNANFAAVQTAVNSKQDRGGASPGASGTRLKVVGLKSADGSAASFPSNYSIPTYYDSLLQVYCFPSRQSAAPGEAVWRCLPDTTVSLLAANDKYFSDAACTVEVAGVYRTGTGQPVTSLPPLPARSVKYVQDRVGNDISHKRAIPYTSPTYQRIFSTGGCQPNSVELWTAGAPVPITDFAELTPSFL